MQLLAITLCMSQLIIRPHLLHDFPDYFLQLLRKSFRQCQPHVQVIFVTISLSFKAIWIWYADTSYTAGFTCT